MRPVMPAFLLILILTALMGYSASATAAPQPIVLLSADAVPAGSAAVTAWANAGAGGSAYDATATPDHAPHLGPNAANNLPLMHFDASHDNYMTLRRPVQDDFTIICVFRSKQGIGDSPAYFAGAGLVQGEVGGVVSDFGMALNSLGEVTAGTGMPDVSMASSQGYNDGKLHAAVLTRVKSTGTLTLIVDDSPPATTKGGTQSLVAPAQLGIGALMSGGLSLDGDIAMVEIFDSALSDDDRMAVVASLRQKWGMQ
jgi:hypothetical protein